MKIRRAKNRFIRKPSIKARGNRKPPVELEELPFDFDDSDLQPGLFKWWGRDDSVMNYLNRRYPNPHPCGDFLKAVARVRIAEAK